MLEVADNSGAKKVMCIKVLGGSARMIKCERHRRSGEVHRALIVRTKKGVRRPDGSTIVFDSNSAVLLNKKNKTIGTRVFRPVPRELRGRGFMNIISLAEEVI